MTSRAYLFTVQADDTILLSTSTDVYVLDLNGEVISRQPDEGTKTFNSLQWKRKFTAADGDVYYKQWNFGRTRIDRVGNTGKYTVYIMPVGEYILKLLVIFAWICFMVTFPVCRLKAKGKSIKDVIAYIKDKEFSEVRKFFKMKIANIF